MLEIAIFDAPSALPAALAGASRLELCANYPAGGVTPSLSTLQTIHQTLRAKTDRPVPIHVMIRPRGGDFIYSAGELAQMKAEIEEFKATGLVDGFVLGVLDPAGCIDRGSNGELVDAAAPVPCTFHRAMDGVGDLDAAFEAVIELGFRSVLTSGGPGDASAGVERVKGLQERFGRRISVVLGGGIRSGNVQELKRRAGVEWVHSAAITGGGEGVDEDEVGRMVKLLRVA
jgi:copper homeostasis protein